MKVQFAVKLEKVPDHKAVGAAIRKKRKALGLDQADVAAAAGIKGPYLSELERGSRNWNKALFDRVVSAMNRLSKNGK
jgi:transcriptional regulator with XRE-family HTH domain